MDRHEQAAPFTFSLDNDKDQWDGLTGSECGDGILLRKVRDECLQRLLGESVANARHRPRLRAELAMGLEDGVALLSGGVGRLVAELRAPLLLHGFVRPASPERLRFLSPIAGSLRGDQPDEVCHLLCRPRRLTPRLT